MSVEPEAPRTLPIDHLSLSSLRLYAQCPEKFRRRYLAREYEPASGPMVLGSAAGAAESRSYSAKIDDGEGFSVEQVLDEFSDEYEDRVERENIDWGNDDRAALKDSGAAALEIYHERIQPQVVPTSVERKFELSWEGLDWNVIGFLDLEDSAGAVRDLKMRGRRMSQRDADSDPQASLYLAARRAEGAIAPGMAFDCMIRSSRPSAEVISTERTDLQLDHTLGWILAIARDLDYRAQSGNWIGAAPSTWFCSTCSYLGCPFRLGPEPS